MHLLRAARYLSGVQKANRMASASMEIMAKRFGADRQDGNQALTEANLQALNLINESLESIGLDHIDPLLSLIAKPNPPDANALEFTEDDMVNYDDSLLDFGSVRSLYGTPPSKQISPWESESNSGSGSCDMGRRVSSRSEEEQPNATNQVIEDAKLVWELAKGFVRAMPL